MGKSFTHRVCDEASQTSGIAAANLKFAARPYANASECEENMKENLSGKNIGFAITASYCTFKSILEPLKALVEYGANVFPIMSENASSIDSRFQKAEEYKETIRSITGNDIIDTIKDAEPIGPNAPFDILVVAPCTGNTIAKLAHGITDTSVTMACKAHIRNNRPLLIAISTNDALSGNAANIGKLLNTANYYFVPFSQDNALKKPRSLVAHMDLIPESIEKALEGVQLQPIICK